MKKALYILSLFLCCALLVGCGGKEGDAQQNGLAEYTDVLAGLETIFSQEDSVRYVVGMQFYQGEAVQICTSRNGRGTTDIFLYREDGSRELLLEGMPEEYFSGHWFLDAEGNLYRWTYMGSLVKMDPSGRTLYSTLLDDIGAGSGLADICQLADGRVLITYMEGRSVSNYTLSEVDPATGGASKVSTVKLDGFGRIAAGKDGLLYMDASGVSEINMETGGKTTLLSFTGTSYLLQQKDKDAIEDFRMLEDGSVEILRHERNRATGEEAYTSEVLRAGTESTQKAILELRCCGLSRVTSGVKGWLKSQMALFNQQNGAYMVVLDECPETTEREDFARQTSIEIAAGRGPDLIFGNVLGEYVYGAIQKGMLVDLMPYMDASGIREEDYFPAAFGCWKENGGIYGVGLSMSLDSYRISRDVLGEGDRGLDIETLVDALLAWQEDATFVEYRDSRRILEYLLQGSEDLWGMVDWEAGTCDFSGGLFGRILEAAERYGYNERNNYPEIAEYRAIDLLRYDTAADREAEGMAVSGGLFDDGCHAVIRNSFHDAGCELLAVNANSAHVEGAWEFISFLLGEKAQTAFESDDPDRMGYAIPVNRKAFEVCTGKRIAKWTKDKSEMYACFGWLPSGEVVEKYKRSYKELTEEKLAEYREFLEDARPLPIRTIPLLDIIYEEAEYYFNGSKSIEEVSAIIQNRVQLYMDENM